MSVDTIKSSRILLSPLNWGLGHVARTIPIIKILLANNNEVFICCEENQERFYREYFPTLWYISHEGYPFKFKGKGRWTLDLLKNIPSLHAFYKKEQERVEELVIKFNINLVIADQRFGFISKNVKSIIISHQLSLPVSKWNFIARSWNKQLLKAFDEIWIPDTSNQEFSGELSNGNYKKKQFVGICSRFSLYELQEEPIQFKYLAIVSGPLPYSQLFLNQLIETLGNSEAKAAIIAPQELDYSNTDCKNIRFISSPTPKEFNELMQTSQTIISRSGYSTLMDLAELQKEAILIPTPGQQEQVYLAKLHQKNPKWKFIDNLKLITLKQ